MRIVPFEPEHLQTLLLQPSQAMLQPTLSDPEYGQSLAHAGPAYSLVDGDVVFASAGFVPQWRDRAVVWALISAEVSPHMVTLTRAVRRALQLHHFRRVETSVACDFEQAHRWAKMLGFEREGRMRAFTPDGQDCDLNARIS
jgi:hypothetical protein